MAARKMEAGFQFESAIAERKLAGKTTSASALLKRGHKSIFGAAAF
jgi:hypothetical protein